MFLLGLSKFGKGDWRSISRNFVVSRTPTQVTVALLANIVQLAESQCCPYHCTSIIQLAEQGVMLCWLCRWPPMRRSTSSASTP